MPRNLTSRRFVQFPNAPSRREITFAGISMLVRLVQPSKALTEITCKLLGSVTEVSSVQFINDHAAMLIKVSGKVTEVKSLS